MTMDEALDALGRAGFETGMKEFGYDPTSFPWHQQPESVRSGWRKAAEVMIAIYATLDGRIEGASPKAEPAPDADTPITTWRDRSPLL